MPDDSWFYFSTDHERIWLASGEAASDPERHTIQSPKFMLTIVGGVTGFQVIKLFQKGGTLNVSDDTGEILSEIASWHEAQGGNPNRRLIVEADNARPQSGDRTLRYIEGCGMVRAPHPPYSPDRAPADFFRVGYLKSMLQGGHFETGEELLAAIMNLTGPIEKETLERVFLEGMHGLAKCISTNGDHIGGDEEQIKDWECLIQ